MKKETIIAPSILSADFSNLDKEIKSIMYPAVKFLHFDVMDGVFVENISFGAPVLKCISHQYGLINDVHLMICNPKKYYMDFVKAGANYITFHVEALPTEYEIIELINLIKKENVKVGLSIKPNTPINVLDKFLPLIDLVLIMSVEPGFGGQAFNENSIKRISELRKKIDSSKLDILISVDGGINDKTSKRVIKAGADVLVAGSYLFGKTDIEERINKLCK